MGLSRRHWPRLAEGWSPEFSEREVEVRMDGSISHTVSQAVSGERMLLKNRKDASCRGRCGGML